MIRGCSVDGRDWSRQCVSGGGVGKVGIPGRGVTSDRCAWLKLTEVQTSKPQIGEMDL